MLRRLVVVRGVLGASGAAGTEGAEETRQPNAAQERRSVFTLGWCSASCGPAFAADVAQRLGSPNILTRDAAGREAWVYDGSRRSSSRRTKASPSAASAAAAARLSAERSASAPAATSRKASHRSAR